MVLISEAITSIFKMLLGMFVDVLKLAVTNELMLFGLALIFSLSFFSFSFKKIKSTDTFSKSSSSSNSLVTLDDEDTYNEPSPIDFMADDEDFYHFSDEEDSNPYLSAEEILNPKSVKF